GAAAAPWPGQGRWRVWAAGAAAAALLMAVTVGGVVESARGRVYPPDAHEVPLLAFVEGPRRPGDVYLIPAALPKPAAGEVGGSVTLRPGGSAVSWDLQRFRLLTGAAAYVDGKAIPYQDAEVLEWYRRVRQAEQW